MSKLITFVILTAVVLTVSADGLSRRRALMKQKTSAGGSSFSPSDVSGMVFWLDTDSLSGSDGDAMATFSDVSGNNHHFSHSVSGNRPILTNSTSVLNNKKTLWWDGSSDQLTNKTYTLQASDYTFYAVFKFKDAYHNFNNGYLLDDSSGTTEFSIRAHDTASHVFLVYDGANVKSAGPVADTQPRVVSVVMNSTGTALNVYTNGIIAGSAGTFAQPAVANYLTLGSLQDVAGGSFYNGIMGDVLLYTGAHGTTDRQNIEDYLGTKFGVTINH